MKRQFILSFLALFLFTISLNAQIRVNEIVASNSASYSDENGKFGDWIEIYNGSNISVNIGGYYFSDDPAQPTKWQLPTNKSASTTIGAKSFLILWADGALTDGPLHLDFKLSASGESVVITAADGTTLVDSVTFPSQTTDISWARDVDGTGTFSYANPTPNATNAGSIIVNETASTPTFSLPSGFYPAGLTLAISSETPSAAIHYTLNGSVPTINSAVYTTPITTDTSIVLRAIAFEAGKDPSKVATNTYLIGNQHTIPIVSFVMEPDSLFDYDKGMYVIGDSSETTGVYPFKGANFWEDFTYPVHIEYIDENGNTGFEFDAGARIAGNYSRAFPKKSFMVNNNSKYGTNKFTYPLFPENDYNDYDGFVLRASAEERSRLLNEIVRTVNLEGNHANAMQSTRPVILYINGKYWGIYSIQERKNDDFVEARYGAKDIDLIKGYDTPTEGDYVAYAAMINRILDETLTGDDFFQYIESVLDIDSFTDHWIYQVYTSHGDENNIRYWSDRDPMGIEHPRFWLPTPDNTSLTVNTKKWSYISYDFDWWQNLGVENPANYYSTFREFLTDNTGGYQLLGRMMENDTYKKIFLTRLADLMNTSFKPDYMMALIDSIDTSIAPEIQQDIARWTDGWYDIGGPTNYDMEYIRTITEWYVQDIPDYLYGEISDTLQTDTVRVNLNNIENGLVQVNTIKPTLSNGNWSGIYFTDTELYINAIPAIGYEFAGWIINGENNSSSPSITIPLTTVPLNITAQFQSAERIIVINEINYKSSPDFDTGDWVELHNTSSEAVNLSGWVLKDDDDTHEYIIPEGTSIAANGYLVLTRNSALFTALNTTVDNYIGDFDFGLGGTADQVRLFNNNGTLVDFVAYTNEAPWPTAAAGNGPTLELTDPSSDNSLAENWFAATETGGTPGRENGVLYTSTEDDSSVPSKFELSQNYPNPFNPTTNISFNIQKAGNVELSVYNMLGQKISTLINAPLSAGIHSVTFDAQNLSSGVYLYRIVAGNHTKTMRMVLLK
ncbi:MAG: lamin tail domain-containing protein [Balneolaceae bacterium]